jgi:hypothetical protein
MELAHLLKPKPWAWTGNKAFERVREKRFRDLGAILSHNDFTTYCFSIGFVEVNWAIIESQMDRWVQVAFAKLNIRPGGKEVQTNFSGKARYLKIAFKNPLLSKFRKEGLALVAEMERLSETRHDLTHGVIKSVSPVDLFRYELVNRRLDRKTAFHTIKEVSFDMRDFPKLGTQLLELGAR